MQRMSSPFLKSGSSASGKMRRMKKDTRITFRVQSHLKKALEAIAAREGRSVAQICEAFLKAGSETYRKGGSRFLQRFLVQRKPRSKDQ